MCGMKYRRSIETLPLVQTPAGIQKIVDEAAFSRVHAIYDGLGCWEIYHAEHRSSADTGSSDFAPG
jgi:hypothetical protein